MSENFEIGMKKEKKNAILLIEFEAACDVMEKLYTKPSVIRGREKEAFTLLETENENRFFLSLL